MIEYESKYFEFYTIYFKFNPESNKVCILNKVSTEPENSF